MAHVASFQDHQFILVHTIQGVPELSKQKKDTANVYIAHSSWASTKPESETQVVAGWQKESTG